MASSGWQGRKDFPYNHSDIKCNLRIDSISHSGSNLRVTGAIGAVDIDSSTGYYAWYDYPVYVTPQNGSEMTLLSGSEKVYGGGESNAKTVGFDVTISAAATSTSANFTVHVRMNNNTASGDLTWGLNFDASVSPPTGLNVTNITATKDSFNANVSVSSWGVGSGSKYRELQVWTRGMVEPRRYKSAYGDATSGYITCDNNSSGSLTITPNTTYTIGGYASNGSKNVGSTGFGDKTTLPPVPSASFNSKSATGFSFNYSLPNQGGAQTINLQYKVGSGSWTTGKTITGSGSKSGQVSVDGLVPNTSYSVAFRTNTSAGSTNGNTVSDIYTSVPTPIMEVGAVGKHEATLNYYVPEQGATKTLYLEIAVDGGDWTQKVTIDSAGEKYGSITLTGFAPETSHSVQYRLRSQDGTTVSAGPIEFTTHETYAKMYCSVNNVAKTVTKMYCSVDGVRKRVKKVYCSVNGIRKLAWEEP